MAEQTAALTPETPREGAQPRTAQASSHTITWHALPTFGDGIARIALALLLGLLTGLLWALVGHIPPSGLLPAVIWALTLGAPTLVALLATLALERGLRGDALRHARPAIVTALTAFAVLLLTMTLVVTLLPDTFALGVPILFSLTLGLGAGFALGAMRLWGMSRDARWLFVALGVACLFGVTLTFIAPAALAPQDNGSLGFYGCLLYILGLPGVALGSIAGGALRMRAEVEAYGYRTDGATPAESELPAVNDAPTTPDQPHPAAADQPPLTADQLIATLTAQRQQLLDALAGLSDDQLDRKDTVGDWSIKNALAHLTAWEQIVTQITPERLRTGAYPEALRAINADEDANNAREIAERERLTPTEQLTALAQARADLTALIRSLGDAALARARPWPEWDPPLARYFLDNIGGHETEHAHPIRAAAASLRTPLDAT
jgi:hypothetical protein